MVWEESIRLTENMTNHLNRIHEIAGTANLSLSMTATAQLISEIQPIVRVPDSALDAFNQTQSAIANISSFMPPSVLPHIANALKATWAFHMPPELLRNIEIMNEQLRGFRAVQEAASRVMATQAEDFRLKCTEYEIDDFISAAESVFKEAKTTYESSGGESAESFSDRAFEVIKNLMESKTFSNFLAVLSIVISSVTGNGLNISIEQNYYNIEQNFYTTEQITSAPPEASTNENESAALTEFLRTADAVLEAEEDGLVHRNEPGE
jgi:hypothetical protein